MSLTPSDVERIAELARIDLSPDEVRDTLAQLNGIFGLIETMQAVDTRGIEPVSSPVEFMGDAQLRLRDDAVTESVDRDANQKSAPAVQDGLYLVPRVVE